MSTSECYSESEHDDPEITDTPPPPYMAQSQPPQLVSVILISFIWHLVGISLSPRGRLLPNNLNQRLETSTLCV